MHLWPSLKVRDSFKIDRLRKFERYSSDKKKQDDQSQCSKQVSCRRFRPFPFCRDLLLIFTCCFCFGSKPFSFYLSAVEFWRSSLFGVSELCHRNLSFVCAYIVLFLLKFCWFWCYSLSISLDWYWVVVFVVEYSWIIAELCFLALSRYGFSAEIVLFSLFYILSFHFLFWVFWTLTIFDGRTLHMSSLMDLPLNSSGNVELCKMFLYS